MAKVKIEAITNIAGPDGCLNSGKVGEFEKEAADNLVKAGCAKYVKEPKVKKEEKKKEEEPQVDLKKGDEPEKTEDAEVKEGAEKETADQRKNFFNK